MASDTICSFNTTAKDISNQIKTSTTNKQYQYIIVQLIQIYNKNKL